MNCHQTRQLVSAYLDQELTGQQMLEISAHLHLCPTCAREWQETSDVRRLLRALSHPAPPDQAQRKLAARLQHEEAWGLACLIGFARPMFPLPPSQWGETPPPGRRPQGRRAAYALALASVAVLAVAAPFAPSSGDAAGILTARFSQPQPSDFSGQGAMQSGQSPSLRLTGAAGAIEDDPLNDDTISGYVRGEATMAWYQTANDGAR